MDEPTLEERIFQLEMSIRRNETTLQELKQRVDFFGGVDVISMRNKLDRVEEEINRYKVL